MLVLPVLDLLLFSFQTMCSLLVIHFQNCVCWNALNLSKREAFFNLLVLKEVSKSHFIYCAPYIYVKRSNIYDWPYLLLKTVPDQASYSFQKNNIFELLKAKIFSSRRNHAMKTSLYLEQNLRLAAPNFQNCVCSIGLFWLKSKIFLDGTVFIYKLSTLIFFCHDLKYTRNCTLFSFSSMWLLFCFACFVLVFCKCEWYLIFWILQDCIKYLILTS